MARKFTQRKSFTSINAMTEAQLRKEFTTMRDIFQKRVKRLAASGSKKAEPFLPGGYREIPTLKQMYGSDYSKGLTAAQRVEMLRTEVKDLANLLGRREQGRIVGTEFSISALMLKRKAYDEQIVNSLHNAGYEHISKSTLRNFGKFMDAMRTQYGKKLPNSEEMAEFFDSLKYNTKKRSTQFIVDLWTEFEKNGYEPDHGNQDFFAT